MLLSAYLWFSKWNAPLWRLIAKRRLINDKENRARLHERFGKTTLQRPSGPIIWFHGASVGEALTALGLGQEMRKRRPELNVLITTGTRTSAQIIAERAQNGIIHQFIPFDNHGFVQSFLEHWRPQLGIFTESELWPRLIENAYLSDIPLMLVNGQISQKTEKKWHRYSQTASHVLSRFSAFGVQSMHMADTLTQFNVSRDKIHINGTLKQEQEALPHDEQTLKTLQQIWQDRRIWVAASTHAPEEEMIFKAQKKLPSDHVLVLVPRHPERGPALAEQAQEVGLNAVLRSQVPMPANDTSLYIADTLGELGLWYRLASVAFIGGSLSQTGGHNPFEPVQLNCTIFHGPHVQNFAQAYATLDAANAAHCVQNVDDIICALHDILQNTPEQAQRAKNALASTGGARKVTCDKIEAILDSRGTCTG